MNLCNSTTLLFYFFMFFIIMQQIDIKMSAFVSSNLLLWCTLNIILAICALCHLLSETNYYLADLKNVNFVLQTCECSNNNHNTGHNDNHGNGDNETHDCAPTQNILDVAGNKNTINTVSGVVAKNTENVSGVSGALGAVCSNSKPEVATSLNTSLITA